MKPVTALLALTALSTGLAAADAATAAAKPYPLDTCIISGDKLGSMGAPVVIVREGREIKLCCKGCIKDFDKDPAKFLGKIAQAEKARSATAAATAPAGAHHH
ncbi:MAG: hypothetical protein L6R48_10790 [Planctomycetes bacterium]|nr:hypothetical protein [Planctomycetota bacterium]